jgi:hypothetical protein
MSATVQSDEPHTLERVVENRPVQAAFPGQANGQKVALQNLTILLRFRAFT